MLVAIQFQFNMPLSKDTHVIQLTVNYAVLIENNLLIWLNSSLVLQLRSKYQIIATQWVLKCNKWPLK